jgi:hypothetical protein
MTIVYKNTIATFPGAFMVLSATLYFLIVVDLSIVYKLLKMSGFSEDDHDEEEDEQIIIENEQLGNLGHNSEN